MNRLRDEILHPEKVWSRDEISVRPSPVPAAAGVYGWYFREVPPRIPARGCERYDGLTLLYLGISPGRLGSRRNLQTRIRTHFKPRGYSTLRRSLGVLLEGRLQLRVNLRPDGRFDYGQTEESLTDWMSRNAYVVWSEYPEPWVVKPELIASLDLPLNIDHNSQHAFCPRLRALRADALERARSGSS